NATLAHRFWGGAANAIGKRIRFADGDWRSVVGVVADVKYARIDESPRPFIYVPFFQSYRGNMVLHTRGTSTAAAAGASVERLVEQARALVASLDPDLPIVSARPLTAMRRGATILVDLMATMLFVFGAAGMALAALGTYGLVSYVVRQSTHEIGI